VLVAVVGLSGQLHLDALILVFAAALTWLRGYWKPHWGGVAIGVAVTALSFVPYTLAVLEDPSVLPMSAPKDDHYLGSGFVLVWPILKGASYWIRYPSISGSSTEMLVFEFAPSFGSAAAAWLDPMAKGVAYLAGALSLPLVLCAGLQAWRRLRRARRAPRETRSARTWLVGYTLWMLVSCLVANGLSPAHTMWWHNLIAFHATVIPLVLWGDRLLRSRHALLARNVLTAWAVLALLVGLSMSVASPHYRPGGRDHDRHGPWSDRALLVRQGIEQPFEWERPGSNRIMSELGVPGEGSGEPADR
jgi:hypothetical protein